MKQPANHAFNRLTTAALLLPGLFHTQAHAADDDSVDFQYSHYQEGRREKQAQYIDMFGGKSYVPPDKRAPIEVDSLHGSARITLTDRVKFAFNYIQDTWAGATPFGSVPKGSPAIGFIGTYRTPDKLTIGGASPYAQRDVVVDSKGNVLTDLLDPKTFAFVGVRKDNGIVHVMSYASPETRKQGDFKLSYEWDDAAVTLGGGISLENDYESRFVNLGGTMDFNQKQTTVDLSLSYTNSDINAMLNHDGLNFFTWSGQHADQISSGKITGNRQDWATHLGLTQVINRDAVAELGMSYTRSTGFLENPYKLSWFFGPATLLRPDVYIKSFKAFIEQRPDERNLWQWNIGWNQFITPLDAALHFDYSFAHDDWGINAHTFEADWVQPLGRGWTITPRIRYYSQSAANFYGAFFNSSGKAFNYNQTHADTGTETLGTPDNFSSDQRLSGYGTLSGGITVSKQFAKGVGIEAGVEYFTHQGDLKLGGGGEGNFADFDYWVANAALKVNMAALGGNALLGGQHNHAHGGHGNLPAGLLFAHTLDSAGDWMLGYRYQRSWQAGSYLRGEDKAATAEVLDQGCPGAGTVLYGSDGHLTGFDTDCLSQTLAKSMDMSMHMLELMYAPTDWLTLMLMPQFMDMEMPLVFQGQSVEGDHGGSHTHIHQTGGIGDTGIYALIKLFDQSNQHLHVSLGFSAPTGDSNLKLKERSYNQDAGYMHYGMQLGSGTWDFKPSLTYTGNMGDWSWGAQVGGTKRMESSNDSGYALGDAFDGSVWGGYNLTNWLSTTIRVAYNWQDAIHGRYKRSDRNDYYIGTCKRGDFTYQDDTNGDGIPDGPKVFHDNYYQDCLLSFKDRQLQNESNDRQTPMDHGSNYGGHYVDLGLGLSVNIPHGAFAGNRLSFEWLQPVYTNVNGYQLDRDGALSFTWSYGF
jgi:Protein of unknown function (DUF3570)